MKAPQEGILVLREGILVKASRDLREGIRDIRVKASRDLREVVLAKDLREESSLAKIS